MARLLFVEDHPDVHDFICELLKEHGHETDCVWTKTDAEEARCLAARYASGLLRCGRGLKRSARPYLRATLPCWSFDGMGSCSS